MGHDITESHFAGLGFYKTVIIVRDLSKHFKKNAALSHINFEINEGEAVALWGPNGAGKTTLLRCLLGILDYEGQVEILGMDVKRQGKSVRSLIGYVPQEIRLHLDQTVRETALFYAALRKTSKTRVEALLSEWGLSSERKKPAQDLSGGMKQKLALVITLLSDPPIILLDELTSHLDAVTRNDFEAALEKLKSAGKTLMFCSHRESEVEKIAHRAIILEGGIQK